MTSVYKIVRKIISFPALSSLSPKVLDEKFD